MSSSLRAKMAREAVWTVSDVPTVPDHTLPLRYDRFSSHALLALAPAGNDRCGGDTKTSHADTTLKPDEHRQPLDAT